MKKKSLGILFGAILLLSVINLVSSSAAMMPLEETSEINQNALATQETVSTANPTVAAPELAVDNLPATNRQPGPEKRSRDKSLSTPDRNSNNIRSTDKLSSTTGGIEKKVLVWFEQPFDVYIGQAVSLKLFIENLEITAITVNISVQINGTDWWTTDFKTIQAGETYNKSLPMNTTFVGYYEVNAEVNEAGYFYWTDCWYYVHAKDQVLVMIYQPFEVPVDSQFMVTIHVWNLYSNSVDLKNVSLIINGVLYYNDTVVMTLNPIEDGPLAESFFDIFVSLNTEGHFDVDAYVETVAHGIYWGYCWIDALIDFYLWEYDIRIEQRPEYEINELFTIWIWIESFTHVSRDVYLKVEITLEDGTVNLLYDGNVWVDGEMTVTIPFDLSYDKFGWYDVYAQITYVGDFGNDQMIESWCGFGIVEHVPDYYIWIDQKFVYPAGETFYIYLEVSSNIDITQNVTVHAEINGTTVFMDNVTVGAHGSVSIELILLPSSYPVGYYEIIAWVDDGYGFVYADAWCYFWVEVFVSGYYIYLEQNDWYEAYSDFSIALHIISFTDTDRYVNITVDILLPNGTVDNVLNLTKYWLTNVSDEVHWITLHYELIGGFSVYSQLTIDGSPYPIDGYDDCYFELVEPYWYDLWIEQDWSYEINTWFTIWVWIDSRANIGRNINLTVEITFDDGHVETVWEGEVWVDPHGKVNAPVDLFFDMFGHYEVHAYIEYWDEYLLYYYFDTWCGFDIVEYKPDYWVWIEQDFIYTVNEPFSIFIHVESYYAIDQNITLEVKLNETDVVFYGDVWVNAHDHVIVQISLNLTVTGFYDVHALLTDTITGDFIADNWCRFMIQVHADFYIFIDQWDWYEAYNEFFITIWLYSNIQYSQEVNITVTIDGVNVFYEENFWLDACSYVSFDIWLYYEVIGGHDVKAWMEDDYGLYLEALCYFDIIEYKWLDVWIWQEPFYFLNDAFQIGIVLKASYDEIVNVSLLINGIVVALLENVIVDSHQEKWLYVDMTADFIGPHNVDVEVEHWDPESGNWIIWRNYCYFEVIERDDYYIEIWQDWFYFIDTPFFIEVAVFSNVDYDSTVDLVVELMSADGIYYNNFTFNVFIEARNMSVVRIDLSLSGAWYDVHAMVFGFDRVYDAWCYFDIIPYQDYYIFIEQWDWYPVNEEFGINLWLFNNLDWGRWVNWTLIVTHPSGYQEIYEGTEYLEPEDAHPVTVYLKYDFVGWFDVEARLHADQIYNAFCGFQVEEKRGIDIWIEQDEYYPAYQEFIIRVHLKATYEVDIRIWVDVGGRWFEEWHHLTANVELVLDFYLFFDFEGWMDVKAYVEDIYDYNTWNEAWCGFYVGLPSDYELWIEQDFAYMLDTAFSITVWVYSKIDITKTGHLVVEVKELGIVWEGDVTVEMNAEVNVNINFVSSSFNIEGFYEVHAWFDVDNQHYDAHCGFHVLAYDEFWVLIMQKDFYEVNTPVDIGIIIISNVDYAVSANLSIQVGTLTDEDDVYLIPGEQKEIWFTLHYTETGLIDVHVELEVFGELYVADCGFELIEGGSNEIVQVVIDARDRYDVGEEFFVKFRITNNGQVNEPVKIEIFEDGITIHSEFRDLLPGDTWEFIKTFKYDEEGNHEFQLRADSTISDRTWSNKKAIRIGEELTTTETTTSGSEPPVFSPGFDFITLVVALVSLLTIPAVINRRRKS
ncbi:MAG: hypothetical protein ACXAEU_01015 [Candidatus Hodarchaeales archaeon]|jgi:hypothetical protein